jgi:hypothetical protein
VDGKAVPYNGAACRGDIGGDDGERLGFLESLDGHLAVEIVDGGDFSTPGLCRLGRIEYEDREGFNRE